MRVSIHAPTWGATKAREEEARRERVSIHAPTWGATNGIEFGYFNDEFQSTPPRGGRLRFSASSADVRCFNPRPHVGGDFDIIT